MKYEKPPLSIDEQIDLLTSRGMSVPDRSRATRYLSHINYYRLRIYWAPLEADDNNGDHVFKTGTTFNDALNLYLFDRKLRLLVLEAIERFEISLRTQLVNHMATKHGSHAYLNQSLFKNKYGVCLQEITDEINESHEVWIKHYIEKYEEPSLPPIWSAFEILSFGQLVRWYQIIKARKDKNAIARVYGIEGKVLGSFLTNLNHVRNIAAHHGRLWNRNMTYRITIPAKPEEIISFFNKNEEVNLKVYNTLVMLAYLLRQISFKTTWPMRLKELLGTLDKTLLEEVGLPDGWDSFSIWSETP